MIRLFVKLFRSVQSVVAGAESAEVKEQVHKGGLFDTAANMLGDLEVS